MSDYYDATLLRMFDPWAMHGGLCSVCRSGSRCLDRALHESDNDALNERDDEGYLIAPHFIRVQAAEKAGAKFSTIGDLLKGKTIQKESRP